MAAPASSAPQIGTPSAPASSSEPSPALFKGRCFCSQNTFSLTALPIRSYICHCHDCRLFSGSSFHHMAVFPADSLVINPKQGSDAATAEDIIKPSVTTFGEPGHGTRKFCSKCGSPLLMTVPDSIKEMAGTVIIGVGSIQDSETDERLRPTHEGFCKRREEWLQAAEGAVESEEW